MSNIYRKLIPLGRRKFLRNLRNFAPFKLQLLGCLLVILLSGARARDCYDDSLMPMPLATNDGSGDMEYLAITGCAATGYMYMGGFSKSPNTLWGRPGPLPVMT